MSPDALLPDIATLARVAEQAGLDSLWCGDRLAAGEMCSLDGALALAAAAGVTDRITIGFAIFVPSLRPLAWAAKQVAGLQHIAGHGRLQLGVGLGGGTDEEYQLAGVRRADRARRTDQFLRLLPELLGGKPVPDPGVPGAPVIQIRPAVPVPRLWVGGQSPAALRRTVSFGGGWLSGLQTPGEFAAGTRRLHELADEAGRARPSAGIGLHVAIGTGPAAGLADLTVATMRSFYGMSAERARELAIAGTPAQVAEHLAPYVDAGAELLAVVCDPVPSAEAWELLAEARNLLRRPLTWLRSRRRRRQETATGGRGCRCHRTEPRPRCRPATSR
jgi:alkanesulfonate monooxygenase SsuD/methylene tetrahydromethanopterin reductase-like flavin-dependent oxidoreductase (luciferase family)